MSLRPARGRGEPGCETSRAGGGRSEARGAVPAVRAAAWSSGPNVVLSRGARGARGECPPGRWAAGAAAGVPSPGDARSQSSPSVARNHAPRAQMLAAFVLMLPVP